MINKLRFAIGKTQTRIEKKGYTVKYNTGYLDDVQCIVSVSATRNGTTTAAPNITALLKTLTK